jgi:heat-inducible transcriptional repressor
MEERSNEGLDSRKQTILQAVVVEYVSTAEPVGSEILAAKYPLGVKSATIRNELAEMLELGYLAQPHASAGRIPSDLGYRYYVDRLVIRAELDTAARQTVKKVGSEGESVQEMLRGASRMLSRLTHLLSVGTTARHRDVTVKTAVLSAMGPQQLLFVLALSNGQVENRMVECPEELTLADVGRANEVLQTSLIGKRLRPFSRAKLPAAGHPTVDAVLSSVTGQLRTVARESTRGTLITEGEEYLFAQPEFQKDVAGFADLLRQITEADVLYDAVAPGESLQPVTIGRENRMEEMRSMSIVRQSFYIGDEEAGVIAIVGPTRMQYDRGIPIVNLTAQVLSESLTRYLG